MSFSDHKITTFTHRIADLPDQPNLPADELKARFDSSPEELRQGLNAVCDDADRLEARVDSIITQTFEGVVDKSMLAESLAEELDAKATEASISAESTARAEADDDLQTQINQKCRLICGTYTGNGTDNRLYNLGFQPMAVLIFHQGYRMFEETSDGVEAYGGVAVANMSTHGVALASNGFTLRQTTAPDSSTGLSAMRLNASGQKYVYMAFWR
mgnify:CR=1 FL=1